MSRFKTRQELIDRVLLEIRRDVEKGDLTCIETLIESLPDLNLEAYLPFEDDSIEGEV